MKKIISVISFLIIFSFTGYSQTIKTSVSFLGTEVPGTSDADSFFQGLSADIDVKIVEKNNFRIGGVFNYQRPIIDGGFHLFTSSPAVNTYSLGSQLSYKLGAVEPFATALFGITSTDLPKDTLGKYKFTRTYRGGVDVNLGNFFIRPFYVQYQFLEGFNNNGIRQFGTGAGVRF